MSADSSNHWNAFYQRWKGLPPPLRPHADVVRAIRDHLPAGGGPVLLLGVTPELAAIAPNLLAVDRSEMMIAKVWPGDAAGRRVRRDDWLTMELPPHSFAAAMGDGSLNAVTYPDGQEQVYRQLLRFIKPGGRLVFRVYLTPEPGETIYQVAATAWNKAQGTFHAFKWRLMMALVACSGVANVAVADVRELFISLFPDRLKLAAASGWSEADIASIDVYKDSTEVYSFPTERQFLSLVPKTIRDVKLVPAGTYETGRALPHRRDEFAGMTEMAALPQVAWPEITGKGLECLVSLIKSLEKTQYLSTLEFERCQRIQLEVLAGYAARHSPFFAGRLKHARLKPADFREPGALQRLDVLRRRDIQQAGNAMRCAEVPPRHLPLNKGETSGSTGEPVVVMRTALNRLFWMAMTMREHLWNARDFALRSTSVRANIPALAYKDDWGPPASLLYKTGRSQGIPITADAARQASWISDFDPGYLMHYPNSLEALCDHCEKHAIRFTGLRQIRSIGETLSPALRTRAQKILGAKVVDTYSSNEAGVIAIECPVSGLYHIMAENLIVEIVGEDGAPLNAGEIGRVIVTDLHNFATPLVRYDIGDYAEVAGPCPCGRGLPTLKRILGRERNLVAMPDGTRHWPLVGFHAFREVAPVTQYQLVQHDIRNIEMHLVVERKLTSAEEERLRDIVVGALAHPFTIRFTYFPGNIPRGAGGKFEEFICLAG